MDNGRERDQPQAGEWTTRYVDFSRDSRRNDERLSLRRWQHGDVISFVQPTGQQPVELYVDEVVLFDAGDAKGVTHEKFLDLTRRAAGAPDAPAQADLSARLSAIPQV
jgi:hypothetical protein